MQYRTDPRSGNRLSVLGFGLMRLPRGLAGIDQDKVTALVRQAVAGGVNYFDTAYVYPGSEAAMGRALAALAAEEAGGAGLAGAATDGAAAGGEPAVGAQPDPAAAPLRDRIFLASKLPHQQVSSPDDLDRIFEEQLRRLQAGRIDYYLIHNLSLPAQWRRLSELGLEGWLGARRAAGQLGQVGFSFHGRQADFLALLDAYDWDFTQIQYNYLDESFQAGRVGLQAAAGRGLMVVVMEPLRGGALANRLPPAAARLAAVEPPRSPAAWALSWLFDQPEPTVVLSGMSSPEQLADNLGTAARAHPQMLTPGQRELLEEVVGLVRAGYRVPCTGCGYCLPCPQGVNIPDCFAALNTRVTQGLVAGVSQYMTGLASPHPERYSGPGRCVACGACERRCPQGIAIIESLAEVRRRMEPFWFKPAMAIARLVLG